MVHTADSPTRGNADMKQASKQGQKALKELMSPVRPALMAGNALALVSAALRVFPFVALVGIGNELMGALSAGSIDRAAVNWWVVVLLATFCGGLLTYFAGLMITHIADNRLSATIQRRIIDSLAATPLTWFSENTSGHVRKVLQDDVRNLHMLVAHRPVDSIIAIFLPLFSTAYAFFIDWRLGLLVILPIVVYAIIYAVMVRDMNAKTMELDAKLDTVSSAMVEFVKGIQVVKTFGITGKAHRKYADSANNACDFMEEWNRPMVNAASVTSAVVSTPVIVLLFSAGGFWFVSGGWVTPVEIIAGCLIAISLPNSINLLAQMAWNYQLAGAAASRVLEVVDVVTLPSPDRSAAQPAQPSVELRNIVLDYGHTRALEGVSVTCEPGTTTALMGPSGAGKSTLAKLVPRFLDPDEGQVLIGGVDVKDLSRDDLYRQVSFVLQDAQLLRATVFDNIAMGKPQATFAEVEEAARRARIHDEIMEFPGGYDTVVDEDVKLSGGQAQRIAIARALLRDTPILILDEAAAMVDPECEAQIQAAINELTIGRTVIVIDHRPQSVRHVDQIVLLDGGHVVACGPHEEILNQDLYARLRAAAGADREEE
ncbi:ABC transporter ATP-binding protein [Trueperella pyogenes]